MIYEYAELWMQGYRINNKKIMHDVPVKRA